MTGMRFQPRNQYIICWLHMRERGIKSCLLNEDEHTRIGVADERSEEVPELLVCKNFTLSANRSIITRNQISF